MAVQNSATWYDFSAATALAIALLMSPSLTSGAATGRQLNTGRLDLIGLVELPPVWSQVYVEQLHELKNLCGVDANFWMHGLRKEPQERFIVATRQLEPWIGEDVVVGPVGIV